MNTPEDQGDSIGSLRAKLLAAREAANAWRLKALNYKQKAQDAVATKIELEQLRAYLASLEHLDVHDALEEMRMKLAAAATFRAEWEKIWNANKKMRAELDRLKGNLPARVPLLNRFIKKIACFWGKGR